MNYSDKIDIVLARKNISQSELARAIGTTPSNFNQKYRNNTLRQDDLEKIASALGATFYFGFEFDDGTKI